MNMNMNINSKQRLEFDPVKEQLKGDLSPAKPTRRGEVLQRDLQPKSPQQPGLIIEKRPEDL